MYMSIVCMSVSHIPLVAEEVRREGILFSGVGAREYSIVSTSNNFEKKIGLWL